MFKITHKSWTTTCTLYNDNKALVSKFQGRLWILTRLVRVSLMYYFFSILFYLNSYDLLLPSFTCPFLLLLLMIFGLPLPFFCSFNLDQLTLSCPCISLSPLNMIFLIFLITPIFKQISSFWIISFHVKRTPFEHVLQIYKTNVHCCFIYSLCTACD